MASTLDPATVLNGTLSGGNLIYSYTTPSADGGAFATSSAAKSSGKWYMEAQLTVLASGSDSCFGIGISGTATISGLGGGGAANGCVVYDSRAIWKGGSSTGQLVPGRAFATGDWLGIRLDLTANTVTFENVTSGGGVSAAISISAGTYLPAVVSNASTEKWTVNFGATSFQQAVPTGFSGWDGSAITIPPMSHAALIC
jgi:hypothetical protein